MDILHLVYLKPLQPSWVLMYSDPCPVRSQMFGYVNMFWCGGFGGYWKKKVVDTPTRSHRDGHTENFCLPPFFFLVLSAWVSRLSMWLCLCEVPWHHACLSVCDSTPGGDHRVVSVPTSPLTPLVETDIAHPFFSMGLSVRSSLKKMREILLNYAELLSILLNLLRLHYAIKIIEWNSYCIACIAFFSLLLG